MRSFFIVGIIALLLAALPGVVAFAADLFGAGSDLNTWAEKTLGLSHRLALATPAALVLFFVPPAIVLLYFLRLKRRPLTVASTYLWKKSVEDLHVNRLMQWMRRNVLLLLQLLCILLVIYAVLGVRTQGALTGGRHYIILIDNSASMTATDVSPTRLDWAKAEALKLIAAAHDGDPGMVIVFNSTAEIRQSYTTNKDELRAAVTAVEPTQHLTRIDEALALAASRANPTRSTENVVASPDNPEPGKERTYFAPDGFEADVYLLSDGRFPPVQDFALRNLSVRYPEMPNAVGGGRSDNVAVVGFDVSRVGEREGQFIAAARLANYRADASKVKVWLDVKRGDGTLVKVYPPTGIPAEDGVVLPPLPEVPAEEAGKAIAPGTLPANVVNVFFALEGIADNADLQLEVRLEHPGDAFKADDSAVLVFGVARKANVLVLTKGNRILRFYFDTKEAKSVANFTYGNPDDWEKEYRTPARDGKYDLIIFDRTGPKTDDDMPAANTLFIGHPPPPYTPLGQGRPDDPNAVTEVKGPRVQAADRRHPLMRDLGGVEEIGIDSCFRFPVLPPRTPRLLEGRDQADQGNLALAVALSRQAFTDVVLTFPIVTENADGPDRVYHSSWPLQPNFPLFLRNVLIQQGNVRFAGVDDPLHPGEVIPLRPGSAREVLVTKPGSPVPQKFDRGTRPEVAFGNTDALGVYTAEWGSGGDAQRRRFAVNLLDPDESNLSPVSQFQVGDNTVTAGDTRRVPFELWKVILAVGLVVILVEWWIYNRRVQI
jgi:hypothetical protein